MSYKPYNRDKALVYKCTAYLDWQVQVGYVHMYNVYLWPCRAISPKHTSFTQILHVVHPFPPIRHNYHTWACMHTLLWDTLRGFASKTINNTRIYTVDACTCACLYLVVTHLVRYVLCICIICGYFQYNLCCCGFINGLWWLLIIFTKPHLLSSSMDMHT